MCLRFFDSVIYELFLDKRAAKRLLAFQLLSLGSFQARGSKSARKTNTGAGRENGARGFYYLKRARERANGVLLSRETSGPNSSVKTALRDSRLAKDFRKRVHHDSLEQNFEFPRDRIEEKVPPRFWRFRGFQFISFSPLILMYKIVIEIYNLEWKERKLATRSRSKKRASCLFKLSTNWTNVHEYPGNEWRNSIPPWNWVLLVRPLISTGAKMAGVPRVLAPWCISSNADRNRPRYDFAVYSSGISPWNLWRVLHWRETRKIYRRARYGRTNNWSKHGFYPKPGWWWWISVGRMPTVLKRVILFFRLWTASECCLREALIIPIISNRYCTEVITQSVCESLGQHFSRNFHLQRRFFFFFFLFLVNLY